MEEDLFQSDLQEYLENGNLYDRCYFQWSLIQCLVLEKHLLLEMEFVSEETTANSTTLEYARQTTKILERAVNDLQRSLLETLLIGILDPQDEIPALMLGNQVCVQGSPQISYVHPARGARGKSGSDSRHLVHLSLYRPSLFFVS